MKMKVYSFAIFFLAATIFFASCKKDGAPSPTPDPDTEPTLFDAIQGKWNINNSVGRTTKPVASSKIQGEKVLVSLEFLGDSTYIISLDNGEIYSGKIKINDSTTINLSQLGIISNIKFSGESSLSFDLSFDDGGSLMVVTTKAPEIAETAETALICRKWEITSKDTGQAVFNFYGTKEYPLHLLFTKSGTYYLEYFNSLTNAIFNVRTTTWKWHPSKPDTFLYLYEGKESEVTITELTDHSLKMQEDYMDRGSQTILHKEYLLVPVE